MTVPSPTTGEESTGLALPQLLRENAAEIADRWVDKLRDQSAASALPTSELKNSMREFVEEIAGALEQDQGAEAIRPAARARQHGEQRFRLGYNIDGLIREYGTLREVLVEFVESHRVPPSPAEALALSGILIEGIASAAAQYSIKRDAQARTQAAQHVGFLAHELRNPLHTAQLRVELMERRGGV
ncbi:MAG TPA: RsbRD N-terminal domain-containing protein, partial [Myxococcaceae bacterium]